MCHRTVWLFLVMLIFGSIGFSEDRERDDGLSVSTDLFYVEVGSHDDAAQLSGVGVNAVMRVKKGFLVLVKSSASASLCNSGLNYRLLDSEISRRQLAMDMSRGTLNKGVFPLIYEEDDLRLYRIEDISRYDRESLNGLAPVRTSGLPIFYKEPIDLTRGFKAEGILHNLDSLIGCISQDSLESYSYKLQTMGYRAVGSSANHQCNLWIRQKLAAFGYDSIVPDPFVEPDWWGDIVSGENVLAYKPGSTYGHDQIVIGAHFDGVPASPAADDNGSGVAATLEIARILADVETNMAIVFGFFDAEENGLVGSEHYARLAADRMDRIVFMLNMDMIAFYRNSTDAHIYNSNDIAYAQLWCDMADSFPSIGITGHLTGSSGGSDHASFGAYGYDALFAHEAIFSTVYHSARDSTSYMDFDYFKRMTMASLATACYVDGNYIPAPTLFLTCPEAYPTFFFPSKPESLKIHVEEYAGGMMSPGSLEMIYSIDGGPSQSISLDGIGGGVYVAPFPAVECGNRVDYYAMASESNTGVLCHFPPTNVSIEGISAASVTIVFDNFETDQGWSTIGNASEGFWERYRASSNWAYPKWDYDGSGRCYITDHEAMVDVDDGISALLSPSFEIAPGDAVIEYARWFSNDQGPNAYTDIFKIYLLHGGQSLMVEAVGPYEQASGGWYKNQFWVGDFVDPVSPVRIRFDASDLGYDSEIEAAVDAFKITYYSYAPHIITETVPDELFGSPINQQLDAAACVNPITWSDVNDDLEGTGLTLSPDGFLSGIPSDTGLISFTARAEDGNGVPSERVYSFHIWKPFVCGDAGMDYQLNVGDAVYLISYIFKGGPAPFPLCVGDANGDGNVDVGDAVYLINHIFKGGAVPVEGCCSL